MKLSSVQSRLFEGRKVNSLICHEQSKPARKPLVQSRKKPCEKEVEARVWKILYPNDPKFTCCSHFDGIVLDRSILSPKQHLNLLARPKKHIMRPCPRWISKTIAPSSLRINQLAQPKTDQLLTTFERHLKHMTIFQIENFLKKLHNRGHQTPEEALKMIQQKSKDRRLRKQKQLKDSRKCDQMSKKKDCGAVEKVSDSIINCFKPFIVEHQKLQLSLEAAKYSEVILAQICKLMKQRIPERNSCSLVDHIFCNIADKIAWWLTSFIENSGFRSLGSNAYDNSDCAKKFNENCYPIDDYYPHETRADSNKESDSSEDEDNEDKMESSEDVDEKNKEIEKKLSFLRKSQIKLDPNDCQLIFDKIKDYYNKNDVDDVNDDDDDDDGDDDDDNDDDDVDDKTDKQESREKLTKKVTKSKATKNKKDSRIKKKSPGKNDKLDKKEKPSKEKLSKEKRGKAEKEKRERSDKTSEKGKRVKADKTVDQGKSGKAVKTAEKEKRGKADKTVDQGKRGKADKTIEKEKRGKADKTIDQGKRGKADKTDKKPERTSRAGRIADSDEELDCFGDVNKTPQWEVEWVDRGYE